MKLAYAQLATHLAKNLAPIYFIHGDELLLTQEAVETIQKTAYAAGYTDRVMTVIDTGMDLEKAIYSDMHSLSLFSSKKVIELNFCHIKFNNTHGKILEEYASKILPDTLLIIRAAKLDSKLEKSTWYQTIAKTGIVIPVWPIPPEQLSAWIIQRAKKNHLNITKQGADFLSAQIEGNLLAAAQEIEKLCLLQLNGPLDQKAIENAVTDHARFDIFTFVDSALSGNAARSIRILRTLAAEETEPTLILWALSRELRVLAELQKKQAEGASLSNLFSQFRIWEKRQPPVRAFLQRHSQTQCWKLLINAASIDRMIKGIETGNTWDSLEELTIKISGNATIG